ncbi:type IV pilus biogenesis protein PilP [Escherichia coli]|nr:type IV pilus biogenesis protein PilP [Escherichia coli]
MNCEHWSRGGPQRPDVSRKAFPQSQQIHRHHYPPPDSNIRCSSSTDCPDRTSGGSISDVKAGQNIPGTTYHVEKITPDSVVLEQSGTRKTLRP